jgi:hypothetical protein
MGSDQDIAGRRTGPFSRHEMRYSTKKSENGFHRHMDARSCRCMVVIMEYDMADNGRYNPDRRKVELIIKREKQDTQHLRKTRAFRLPTNHQQKYLSYLPQHAKA